MKKAWAFGLAAMLGLGVSTVMADQASAFAASAPPTAADTTTQKIDTDQKNTDDQTCVQDDISSEANQTPVITVAETSESVTARHQIPAVNKRSRHRRAVKCLRIPQPRVAGMRTQQQKLGLKRQMPRVKHLAVQYLQLKLSRRAIKVPTNRRRNILLKNKLWW